MNLHRKHGMSTPNTEEMRRAWQEYALKDDGSHQDEFDRWLDSVKAKAWDEGFDTASDDTGLSEMMADLGEDLNPHRKNHD